MALMLTVKNTFWSLCYETEPPLRRRSSSDFGIAYLKDHVDPTIGHSQAATEKDDAASVSTACQGSADGASVCSSDTMSHCLPSTQRCVARLGTKSLQATQLSSLECQDHRCILLLKKVNRLGFGSMEVLTRHYSHYGTVAEVLLSNAHERTGAGQRLRPSGMAWLRFESASSASLALSAGEQQVVEGAHIIVKAFASRAAMNASA